MKEFVIGKNQDKQRINKYLLKILPNATSSFLYKMFRKKNILLNAGKIEGHEILKAGDLIQIYFSDETFEKFSTNQNLDLDQYRAAYEKYHDTEIRYEDDNILVAFKNSNVLSQKATETDLSLNEWLIGYLLAKSVIDEASLLSFKPSVCNRLDRNTSGLLMCSKTLAGSQILGAHIKDRSIQKYYYAVVLGTLDTSMEIRGFLAKDFESNKVKISPFRQNENENEIETDILPVSTNGTLSLIKIHLITGKTHQIRAHLNFIGHPILGDPKYGNLRENERYRKKYKITSQLLCSSELIFPVMEKPLDNLNHKVITTEWEKDFQILAKKEGLI